MWPQLLVSGYGTNPGLYRMDRDKAVSQIDNVPSTGLAKTPWGLFRARALVPIVDEVFIEPGHVVRSVVLEGAKMLHGLSCTEDHLIVVDTQNNRLMFFDLDGTVAIENQFSKVPNSWHMNNLVWKEGQLHVCSFGRFDQEEGWRGAGGEGQGQVFEALTGKLVISGLGSPHSPVWCSHGWLVCDSFNGELLHWDTDRRLVLGGWPRGLVVVGDYAYVGVSNQSRIPGSSPMPTKDPGKVVEVYLPTWAVVSEAQMPCSQIFDLLVV